jgi:hypothetical protein
MLASGAGKTMVTKRIHNSTQRTRAFTFLELLASTVVIVLLAAACALAFQQKHPPPDSSFERLSDVNLLCVGCQLYSVDYSDILPGNDWMDATYPYTKSKQIYHSPEVPERSYGYAFSDELVHKSYRSFGDEQQEKTPMIFDSTNLARNAVAGLETLPYPARYVRGNIIGYMDTHAHFRPSGYTGEIR